ncbi:rhomboid family intramembrane serine protease [Pseudomonas oryzae]|uniref:GlpG protein n=1 Tax=Pseudomonas oryzae TaxID=1392877 RepID=A0A1H1M023_9PSED|nr:rhomboid family intramembrane serine protease [Pseudomonas oryzae]SDR79399.1 GlpG protein [Pseudomonas oryzae]
MSPIAALRLPLDEDLGAFVGLLQRLGVPHRVSEESGELVLWVPDERLAEQVRQLYGQYPGGITASELPPSPAQAAGRTGEVLARLRSLPVTVLVLLATFAVALASWFGDNLQLVSWLTFTDFRIEGDYAWFLPLGDSLAAGQWWRLITPVLVHFGVLHLAMNSLWFWELGRRIEWRQGSLMLLALTLLFGLVSNFAQYLFGGPAIFGGLSGVLYGLLGHCWLFQRLAPNPWYRLPSGVIGMMLVWLLVCLSGLVDALGLGQIANAAHVGGLLAGCVTGVLGGLLARRRG